MAGIAGALFVPIVGIISPANVGVVPSIAFLIGVAIGGRATLLGPALGAIAVAWAQTALSESLPSLWSYFQGALFVLVIAFLPGGLSSVILLRGSWQSRQQSSARIGRASMPEGDVGS
jgi:urea transport system permease protein